ncbi:hypothetical protein K461DRAFT_291000 [Myriangium duriaei CBS 260.36]|uniref:Uncharacterized protein n=1 Tax=Myriangium duriaei CBS 260.36 TaxID=1168546 RepID=A0A9P4JAC6_9PEZI|nr:hypothetical protein K461DRAFT_291000 [Myriangium duriaei CBS 260.36]
MNTLTSALAITRRSVATESMLALRRLSARRPPISLASLRYASTAKPVKARVLEQPDKFRPPSHPARKAKAKSYAGPPLSEHERKAQQTRRYPHMMPPEGSFMRWFLTSRSLHLWITLSVLVSLTFFTILTNFLSSTPFRDQLPPNNLFFSHPLRFLGRWWEVYQMHTDHITAETIARREAKVDDVRKRSEYRKAHGIDEEAGIGGWTFRSESVEKTTLADAEREGGTSPALDQSPVAPENATGEYVDFGGERKPVKKWFGIW